MKPASPHLVSVPTFLVLDHYAQWATHLVDSTPALAGLTPIGWIAHTGTGLLLSVTSSIVFWDVTRNLVRLVILCLEQLIALIDWLESAIVSATAFVSMSIRRNLRKWLTWIIQKLVDDEEKEPNESTLTRL